MMQSAVEREEVKRAIERGDWGRPFCWTGAAETISRRQRMRNMTVAARHVFVGDVVIRMLETRGPDRTVRVEHAFAYVDGDGFEWQVREGLISDGASIPRFAWGIIGSPFTGDYRRGAIVHDQACIDRGQSSAATHWMLRDAARADGARVSTAETVYWSVRLFGPRWATPTTATHR